MFLLICLVSPVNFFLRFKKKTFLFQNFELIRLDYTVLHTPVTGVDSSRPRLLILQ